MAASPLTIVEVAQQIRSVLAGEGEDTARRIAFSFVEAFDKADQERRSQLVAGGPPSTGDRRYDALLGALVEHLCARFGLPSPAWTEEPGRFLEEWWFVSGLRNLHATALVQSPISFARRGVFICDGALEYA